MINKLVLCPTKHDNAAHGQSLLPPGCREHKTKLRLHEDKTLKVVLLSLLKAPPVDSPCQLVLVLSLGHEDLALLHEERHQATEGTARNGQT